MAIKLRKGEYLLATAPDVLSIEQTSQLMQGIIYPRPKLVEDLVREHENDPKWQNLRFIIDDPDPDTKNSYSPSRIHIIGRRPVRARAGKRREA